MNAKTRLALKITLGTVGVLLVALIGGFVFLASAMSSDRSEFREHLAAHPTLPAAASDITLYTNRNLTGAFIADFTIPENDFVKWAAENDWPLAAIDEPARIHDPRQVAAGDLNGRRLVTRGLHASFRRPNGGGIDLAYDRETGRACIARWSR